MRLWIAVGLASWAAASPSQCNHSGMEHSVLALLTTGGQESAVSMWQDIESIQTSSVDRRRMHGTAFQTVRRICWRDLAHHLPAQPGDHTRSLHLIRTEVLSTRDQRALSLVKLESCRDSRGNLLVKMIMARPSSSQNLWAPRFVDVST